MLKQLFAAAAVIAAAALIQPADAIAQPNQPKAAAAKAAPRAAAPRAAAPRAAPRAAARAAPRAAARAAPRAAAPRAARAPNFARSRAIAHQRAAGSRTQVRARAQAAESRRSTARQARQERRNAAREARQNRSAATANQTRANARDARQQRRDAAQSRQERRNARQDRRDQRREAIQNRQDRRNAAQDRNQRLNAQQQLNAQQLRQQRQNARQQRREARQNRRALVTAQQARQGRFAANFARQQARANRVAFRSNRWAWRHHRWAGFVPWYGPVFWPYAYADIFGYTFWPDGYEPGYWAYAYDDFFDGVFWGYEGAPTDYVYAPDEAPSRSARSSAPARYATAQQLCKQPGSGITAWPFADIAKKVNLNAEQKDLLDQMKDASKDAAKQFADSCPPESNFSTTPPGRLDAMTARLDSTLQAVETVRPALERFYASLSDEQKGRFNEIGPDGAKIAAAAKKSETQGSASDQAASCGEPKPGLSNLPIERIEDTVKPDDAQEAKLKDLETATNNAVGILQAACPDDVPMTPPGRLDAMEKRLKAMVEAANTVKPSLDSFYSALDDEQKARFNKLGREIASSND
jgi:hypothetical protein